MLVLDGLPRDDHRWQGHACEYVRNSERGCSEGYWASSAGRKEASREIDRAQTLEVREALQPLVHVHKEFTWLPAWFWHTSWAGPTPQ